MNTFLPPSDAEIERMRGRLFAALPAAARKRRRRRLTLVVALPAGLLVAGATTAGAVIQAMASTDDRNTSFECYTSTDLNSAHGTTIYADDGRDKTTLNPMAERVQFAIQTCVAGYTAVPSDPEFRTPAVDVPNPTACLLTDGRLAVLPNKDDLTVTRFCASLGLASPGA